MYRELKRKRVKVNKILSFWLVLNLLISMVPFHNVGALDFNQLLANIMSGVKDISAFIEKIGGGVIKAGLSTALNQFAQTLAKNSVDQIATGGKGQQPLIFELSVRDMLARAADNATGDFMDSLSQTAGFDLCKPINAPDMNWKFKLTLNIIPDLRAGDKIETPECTVSKFVESTKQTFENITKEIQQTFAQDCFSEFSLGNFGKLPQVVDKTSVYVTDLINNGISAGQSLADGLTAFGGALVSFSLDNLKKYYGYDKMCTIESQYIVLDAQGNDIWRTVNTADCLVKGVDCMKVVKTREVCTESGDQKNCNQQAIPCPGSSTCQVIGGVNYEVENNYQKITGCKPCVFGSGDNNCIKNSVSDNTNIKNQRQGIVADVSMRRRFLNQYEKCFKPKVSKALNEALTLGYIPKDEVEEQTLKAQCRDLVSAVFDNYSKENSNKYGNILKAALTDTQVNNEMAVTKLKAYIKSNLDLFDKVLKFYLQDGSFFAEPQDIDHENEESMVYSKWIYDWETLQASSKFSGLNCLEMKIDQDISILNDTLMQCGLYFSSTDNSLSFIRNQFLGNIVWNIKNLDTSNINIASWYKVREEIVNSCAEMAKNELPRLTRLEQEENQKILAEQSAKLAAEKAEAEKIALAGRAPGDTKDQTTAIAGTVTTPSFILGGDITNSLGAGKEFLQPTGDLFIDPVKIFVTTLLQEGQKSIVQGLFKTLFPEVDYSSEFSPLDDLNTTYAETNGGSIGDVVNNIGSGIESIDDAYNKLVEEIENMPVDTSYCEKAIKKERNSACDYDCDCESNFCLKNRCTLKPLNYPCINGYECSSGKCGGSSGSTCVK